MALRVLVYRKGVDSSGKSLDDLRHTTPFTHQKTYEPYSYLAAKRFYADRAPSRDRDHRDSGRHAPSSIGQGKSQGTAYCLR